MILTVFILFASSGRYARVSVCFSDRTYCLFFSPANSVTVYLICLIVSLPSTSFTPTATGRFSKRISPFLSVTPVRTLLLRLFWSLNSTPSKAIISSEPFTFAFLITLILPFFRTFLNVTDFCPSIGIMVCAFGIS